MKKILICTVVFLFAWNNYAKAQAHGQSESYIWPEEEGVLGKLDAWQDLKFGMIIHWGLYAELGIVESWSICSEEEDWIGRDSTVRYDDYKRWYWSTIDRFKPERFNPEQWAAAGKKAGMRYVVFTTKHHDGFCMFDTKETDFSITKGAFKDHPRNNAAKEVFQAFRNEGYMIGAYFSKPDWHSQYYWWDRYATPNRNNNYSIDKNPARWSRFKTFTYNQIEELVNGDYGAIDILWLDGGWVSKLPEDYKRPSPRYFKGEQDIDMPKIAAMARRYQPSMLIVDRTVPGAYENYQTPERGVPAEQLNHPWESCIPLGNDWGYVPTDVYRSPAKVLHTLVEIVAKGGSLLLGIGPKPDGTLPEEVMNRLAKIGEWTHKNGEAVYGTRNAAIYNDGTVWFTRSKYGSTVYALVCMEEGKPLPEKVSWRGNEPAGEATMRLLHTGKPVQWKKTATGTEVVIPGGLPEDIAVLAFAYQIK